MAASVWVASELLRLSVAKSVPAVGLALDRSIDFGPGGGLVGLGLVQEVAGREVRRGELGYVAEATAKSESPGGSGTRPITRRSSAKIRSKA